MMTPLLFLLGLLPQGGEAAWSAQVERELTRAEYSFRAEEGGTFSAPNRAQGLRARVSRRGLSVSSRAAQGWKLALRTHAFGRAGAMVELDCRGLSSESRRVELRHGALVELLENDRRGIEQSWSVPTAPPGASDAPVRIELELTGGLSAMIIDQRSGALFVDPHGAPRARYHGLLAFDARGARLDAWLESAARGLAVCVDDRAALYPLWIDPILAGPAWTAEGDQDGAQFGWSAAPAGDVNGDGFSDVIVGAPQYDAGENNEGCAFCYLGSPTGLALAPAWTAESDQPGAFFGWDVALAGDVNGDGFSDVIVSAVRHHDAHTDEGRAFVYLGSASGLASAPVWTADGGQPGAFFGESVAGCGDVNGDGFSDIAVGAIGYDGGELDEGRALVFLGSSTGPAAMPSWELESDQAGAALGSAVAPAGDVDGDGFCDILVGAMKFDGPDADEGRAELYLGSAAGLAATPAWSVEGEQPGAFLGRSLACAGDVNADGYADVIIGAYLYDEAETDGGAAWVYAGGPAGLALAPLWTVTGAQAVGRFGRSVAGVGDANGDGFDDLLVGAHVYDGEALDGGRAFLFLGASDGPSTSAAWSVDGSQVDSRLGKIVNAAGDVNGDGYSDLLVTAFRHSEGEALEGRAYVHFGAPCGLAFEPAWSSEGEQELARFGRSSASAGDVNGDGFGDVIVSAYRFDAGELDEGRVFGFHGSAQGLSLTPDWIVEGNQQGALFGYSISSAGDVNGDGYGDVVIGSYGFDAPEQDEGRAFVYHGSPTGLSSTPAWIFESDLAGAKLGLSVSGAGDVNGDGYGDVILGAPGATLGQASEGRAYAFLGSAAGLRATPAWTSESDQAGAELGWSVSRAGDVDGDGFSDVIVGGSGHDDGEQQEGRAWVFHGSHAGLEPVARWTADGNQQNARFAWAVSTAGDVNGDGYSDVLVGAPGFSNGNPAEGAAFAFLGGATGLAPVAAWSVEGGQDVAAFGRSVAGIGDVNDDGLGDVAVAALLYDGDEQDEGLVEVYLGSSSGLALAPDWRRGSGQAGAEFGWSIAGAGDVDGDGDDELVVGAVFWNGGLADEGRAWLFEGNGGRGGWVRAAQQGRSDGSAPIASLARADARDAFRLSAELAGRLAGQSWAAPGVPTARLEWQLAPLGEALGDQVPEQGMSVQPVVPLGGPLLFDEPAGPGRYTKTPWTWRARFVFESSPLRSCTPWFDLSGTTRAEASLRFPRHAQLDAD